MGPSGVRMRTAGRPTNITPFATRMLRTPKRENETAYSRRTHDEFRGKSRRECAGRERETYGRWTGGDVSCKIRHVSVTWNRVSLRRVDPFLCGCARSPCVLSWSVCCDVRPVPPALATVRNGGDGRQVAGGAERRAYAHRGSADQYYPLCYSNAENPQARERNRLLTKDS